MHLHILFKYKQDVVLLRHQEHALDHPVDVDPLDHCQALEIVKSGDSVLGDRYYAPLVVREVAAERSVLVVRLNHGVDEHLAGLRA